MCTHVVHGCVCRCVHTHTCLHEYVYMYMCLHVHMETNSQFQFQVSPLFLSTLHFEIRSLTDLRVHALTRLADHQTPRSCLFVSSHLFQVWVTDLQHYAHFLCVLGIQTSCHACKASPWHFLVLSFFFFDCIKSPYFYHLGFLVCIYMEVKK